MIRGSQCASERNEPEDQASRIDTVIEERYA